MKAFVSIQDFGTDDQKRDLCEKIANATSSDSIAEIHRDGNVVIECDVEELGLLLERLSGDTATNWIEYTVQFDH